jgi:uncharacterized membrane protein
MNSKQQSKYNMYLTTDEFLTANSSVTLLLPNFSRFNATFQNGILEIRMSNEQQSFDKSGIAGNKSQLRKLLVTLAADASRKTQAYATIENNQILLSESKFTESHLKKASDSELEAYAQGIYDKSREHIQDLIPYGITEETQTAFLKAIADFRMAIPTPRNGTISTKLSTDQIAKAFVSCDEALGKIDALVEIVRISHPEFYNGYRSARKIIRFGTGTLQIKGSVVDVNTGEGLKGAVLRFALNDSNNGLMKSTADNGIEVLVKRAAKLGGFNIKSLPEGMYTVTIQKNGYADVTTSIAVTNGETAKLNVELVKNM